MINIFWPHQNTNSITDLLNCLKGILLENSIPFSISSKLDTLSPNIVIESLNPKVTEYIRYFCQKYDKKVIFLVTENYLDLLLNRSLYQLDWNFSTYQDIMNRFKLLTSLSSHIDFLITLGSNLNKKELRSTLGNFDIYNLGYPVFSLELFLAKNEFDFYFSGFLTDYRKKVIKQVRSAGFTVLVQSNFVDDFYRSKEIDMCAMQLNVPQVESWKYISDMRVFFGFLSGKFTVTTNDEKSKKLSNNIFEKEILIFELDKQFKIEYGASKIIDSNEYSYLWSSDQILFLDRVIS
jgi:hypothetical protein